MQDLKLLKADRGQIICKRKLKNRLFQRQRSNFLSNNSSTTNNCYLQSNPSDLVIGYVPTTAVQKSNYSFEKQFQDNFNQVIGLNLSVPIFNNLIVKSNIARAKINLQSAQLDEINIKNQLRKNIEQAYTDQLGAAKQYLAAQEQEKSERVPITDIEKKFENGVLNATDFIIEKNNYNKVKLALLQANTITYLKLK